MSDERKGKPSASNWERYSLCAASYRRERELPVQREETEMSASGDRVHAAMQAAIKGEPAPGLLTGGEEETVEMCAEVFHKLIEKLGWDLGDCELTFETRLWMFNSWSGQIDLLVAHKPSQDALIIDWKSGPKSVTPAASNLQLRSEAVLVWSNMASLRTIHVALVQPWVKGQFTFASYGDADLRQAADEIALTYASIHATHPKVQPGQRQCTYCPVKGSCAEFQEWATAVLSDECALTQTMRETPYLQWGGEQWARFLKARSELRKLLDEAEDFARFILETTPEVIPGWRIGKPGSRDVVTDLPLLCEKLEAHGIKPADFGAICKVSKKDLEDLLREASKHAGEELRGKALKETLAACLNGCTESKPIRGRIEEINPF